MLSNHGVNPDNVQTNLFNFQVHDLNSFKQDLLVLFFPLFVFYDFRNLTFGLFLATELHYLGLFILKSDSKKLVTLRFGDELLGLLLMLEPYVHAFIDRLCEFLNVFHFLSILIIDLLNDFEWPM
jgi:hypothetical protein